MTATVHFGGPDRSLGALRDLLEARVDAVPEGGAIDWMTYYFRDSRLAEALARAHRRGVAVRICVEGRPRHRGANDAVIALLKREVGDGLRVEHRLFGASHLHSNLYAFSGPVRHALVGSFNPSGNQPEDANLIADIGDQDRGHNLLVELDDPAAVDALVDHARFRTRLDGPQLFSFPRGFANPLDRRLEVLGRGARLRIAASHFRSRSMTRTLERLAVRGVAIEVLTHHTRRRTPDSVLSALRSKGIRTLRYDHPDALPMHAKFILAERNGERWAAFGSYNLTNTSRWLNQELLAFSTDAEIWSALDRRWTDMTAEPWCSE